MPFGKDIRRWHGGHMRSVTISTLIRATARRIPDAVDPHAAAAYARMLYEIFHSHQGKENDLIVPMLLAADGVSLSELVGDATAHEGSHHHAHGHPHHEH